MKIHIIYYSILLFVLNIAGANKINPDSSKVKKNSIKYTYIMEPSINKQSALKISNFYIDSVNISFTPNSFGDVNKVISMIPSVSSVSTYNNNTLIIRGGNLREIGYSINNLDLDNTAHFVIAGNDQTGSLGIIDTRLIKNISIHTLGSPVEFRPKISSIIDINLREGNDSIHKQEIDIGINGVGLLLEGPLYKKQTNYLSLFRFSDVNFLKKFFPSYINKIQYGDGLLKLSIPLNPIHEIEILSIASYDIYEEFDRNFYNYCKGNNNSILSSKIFSSGITLKSTRESFTNTFSIQYTLNNSDKNFLYDNESNTAIKIFNMDTLSKYSDSSYSLSIKGLAILKNPIQKFESNKNQVSITNKLTFKPTHNIDALMGSFLNVENMNVYLLSNYIEFNKEINSQNLDYFLSIDIDTMKNRFYMNNIKSVINNKSCIYMPGIYFQLITQFKNSYLITGIRSSYENLSRNFINNFSALIKSNINRTNTISLGLNYSEQLHSNLNDLLYYDLDSISLSYLSPQQCYQSAIEYNTYINNKFSGYLSIYAKYYDHEFLRDTPETYKYDFVFDSPSSYILLDPNGQKISAGIECQLSYTITQKLKSYLSIAVSSTYNEYTNGDLNYDLNGLFRKVYFSFIYNINNNHTFSSCIKVQNGRVNPKIYFDNTLKRYFYDTQNSDFITEYFDPIIELSCRYNVFFRINKSKLNLFIDLYNILNQTPIISKKLTYGHISYTRLNGFIPTIGLSLSF